MDQDIQQFVKLDGEEFVEAAYKLILGREADEAGKAQFTKTLHAGTSKADLLIELCRSQEARQKKLVSAYELEKKLRDVGLYTSNLSPEDIKLIKKAKKIKKLFPFLNEPPLVSVSRGDTELEVQTLTNQLNKVLEGEKTEGYYRTHLNDETYDLYKMLREGKK